MTNNDMTKATLAVGAAAVAAGTAVAKPKPAAVDAALELLETYDWGADRNALKPIDQAIVATQDDAAGRKKLEKSLVDILAGGISRSAQEYVCRRLRVIGTDQSVKALAALLSNEDTSHIARYALERIPDKKAAEAMRDALPKVDGKLKPGLIGSLGVRRDKKSTKPIAKLLSDGDILIAQAAAHSLALIGSSAAAKELTRFAKKARGAMRQRVADACLICAEQLLADGEKAKAMAMYKDLQSGAQPTHVKTAAMKGMVAASRSK